MSTDRLVAGAGVDLTRISHAQNGEDVRIWRALRDVDSPTYVEVGAHDPYEMSVTAALSANGWSGVLIEADPEMAVRLRLARPHDIVVAAAAFDRGGVLHLHHRPKLGQAYVSDDQDELGAETIGLPVSVPAVRLDDVFESAALVDIHFMAVDVEGAEAAVLRGCDLSRWRPWVLCIEATQPDSRTPSYESWEPGLLAANYRFVASDGLNRWYVADEHVDLTPGLSEPFNILDEGLDGWKRAAMVTLESDISAMQDRLTSAEEALKQTQARNRRLDGVEDQQRQTRSELVVAQELLAETRLQLDIAQNQVNATQQRLELVLTSHSWRLAAPLRAARQVAKGGELNALASAALTSADNGLRRHPAVRDWTVTAVARSPLLLRGVSRLTAWHRAALRPSAPSSYDAIEERRNSAASALADGARRRRQA